MFEVGNIERKGESHRGWIIGGFIDQGSSFHSEGFEVKWVRHLRGESKIGKEMMGVKTLGVLISGQFKIELDGESPVVLMKQGDYILYEPCPSHIGTALEDSLLLTIRWPSLQ